MCHPTKVTGALCRLPIVGNAISRPSTSLKNYGMVVVDFAAGNVLYGKELWIYPDKYWNGLLRDWDGGLSIIPLDHYRVLKTIILKKVAIGSKIFFRIC